MSSVHVLSSASTSATLVYHFPVPNTNNSAGVNWRLVVSRSRSTVSAGVTTPPKSVLPSGDGTGGTISPAEATQIANGDVAEVVLVEKNRPSTNAQLDEMYNKRLAQFLAEMQDKFGYYGYTRNVP